VSRIALRKILAEYLNTPAHEVEFCTTKHGKPYLNNQAHAEKVFFSLTHTDRIALVAITGIAPIDVDAERIRLLPDLLEIANRYFHSREARSLASVRGIERTNAFFRCWTRKEAILKAKGTGFSYPLDAFQVSLLPEELSQLIEMCDLATASHFRLFDIQLDAGYSASEAIEGKEKCVLKQFSFHNDTLPAAPDSAGHLDSSSM
jgi:4'-phosphopantetheinyl transferase